MSFDQRTSALVLAADDDVDILMLVQMVLEEEGYEVLTASDGEQALAMAIEHNPDLCVLDVMMPRLGGCEVTAGLRAADQTREIPVILLSARTQWEAVKRGREAGADEYLTKPFVPDDLQRSVRALLSAPRVEEEPVLEMVADREQPTPGIVADPEEPASAAGGLVLVAAGDVNLAKLVAYRLELGGYEVAMAYEPDEVAQIASERPPDLCILDSSMPQPDGCPTMRVNNRVIVQELYGEVERVLAAAPQKQTA